MSTLKVATIQDLSAANSSTPEQIAQGRAKAWVNFNGTGTVAIRDDYNVTSITDSGTGLYVVNFDTAMANANYCVIGMGTQASGNAPVSISKENATAITTTACTITAAQSSTRTDIDHVFVAVFGD